MATAPRRRSSAPAGEAAGGSARGAEVAALPVGTGAMEAAAGERRRERRRRRGEAAVKAERRSPRRSPSPPGEERRGPAGPRAGSRGSR